MAQKVTASLPAELDLGGNYTLRWVALDPTTGDPVVNVVISNVQIHAANLSTLADTALQVGPFMLVPGPETS